MDGGRAPGGAGKSGTKGEYVAASISEYEHPLRTIVQEAAASVPDPVLDARREDAPFPPEMAWQWRAALKYVNCLLPYY